MEKSISEELNENVDVLENMIECYGDLTDIAIEKILKAIKILRYENLELALDLSRVYVHEDFWGRQVQSLRDAVQVI